MKLDSARGLKAHLMESLVESMAMPVRGGTAETRKRKLTKGLRAGVADDDFDLAMAAQPIETVLGVQRSIALGVARKENRSEFTLAVRVQRPSLLHGSLVEQIRKDSKGEVDVRLIGRIAKRTPTRPWYQGRQRPLLMGCSVGHEMVTAGTLGAFVRRKGSDAWHILSNNHVLANENLAEIGDRIVQPGRYDGGRVPRDAVGTLHYSVKLSASKTNLVDAAVAVLLPGVDCDPLGIRDSAGTVIGQLKGLGAEFLDEDQMVGKIGRTTGWTEGRVTAFELDNVVVSYDMGNVRFDDQIEIEGAGAYSFSDGGDSGSLIVDPEFRAVGLLFAGGDSGGSNGLGLTYANPIRTVLSSCKVFI